MMVKMSNKNQILIPKKILKEAGLGPKDIYFDVSCKKGCIILKPIRILKRSKSPIGRL